MRYTICSASCRASGCSRSPTSAAAAGTSRRAAAVRSARSTSTASRSVPLDEPPCATTRRSTSSRARHEPVPRTDAGHRLQRRDDRAVAAAASVPAVRQRAHVRRRRHEPIQLGAGQDREALHARLYGPGGLYVVEVHRARVQAESERHRVRGAAVGVRRAAPRRAQRHLGAAVRQRPAVGGRCERVHRRADRRVEPAGDRAAAERTAHQLPRSQHLLQRRPRTS